MWVQQKGICWWRVAEACRKRKGKMDRSHMNVEHRIPLVHGGSNGLENLVLSCPECNHSKSDKLPEQWIGRLF
jgi:5-methylcytosine-specific restriction endonuclease McrA